MRSLQRQQMDLFAPVQVAPAVPDQQRPKVLTLIQEMLSQAMAASAASAEGEGAREANDE